MAIGGFSWTARVDKQFGITAEPTVTWGTGQGGPGTVLTAPSGSAYLFAEIWLTNSSGQTEPGLDDLGDTRPNPATPFAFVIAQGDAATVGLGTRTFTASDWPLLEGTPPAGPQCTLNGDPSATYGGYCDLRVGDAQIARVMPEDYAPVYNPPVPPGASQQVWIFEGPVSQKVNLDGVRVLAVAQGADHLGFTVIP